MIPPDLGRVALYEAIRRRYPDWSLRKVVLWAPVFRQMLEPALRAYRELDDAMRRMREIIQA